MLAEYASLAKNSKGRMFIENEAKYRDCYQRDRDRIIHSSAFRKLMYKTQVFINYEGDYYRTRLTHSIEVAQIARSIARRLKVNEDLTEAIALAHDIGHPPFGHAGEDGLKDMTKNYNEFCHNAQSLRILTKLENKHLKFNGLNLTWEALEGIVKHNGPINNPHSIIKEYNKLQNLELGNFASIEAQIAAIADDIAYNTHDIDDGLRSGVIKIEDIIELPIIKDNITGNILNKDYKDKIKIIYHSLRKMIALLINDVIQVAEYTIAKYQIKSANCARNLNLQVINFSSEIKNKILIIKEFLYKNLYNSYKINRIKSKVKRIIKDLFEIFINEPECLPKEWFEIMQMTDSQEQKVQTVCDFISGMTDRFAIKEHQRLFDTYNLFQSDTIY